MNSNTPPRRTHVAMLNSLRAIDMMGGNDLKVTDIRGQFSRTTFTQKLPMTSQFAQSHIQRLNEIYFLGWKAKGDSYAKTIGEIVTEIEKDNIPEIFLKSLTVIMPWSSYNDYTLEKTDGYIPFIFHPHPFKPNTWKRLKSTMPSLSLWSRMKELRKILSVDLDEETKKRWRDILLINYPRQTLTNQEIVNIWHTIPCAMLLKESKGNFSLMEVAESK